MFQVGFGLRFSKKKKKIIVIFQSVAKHDHGQVLIPQTVLKTIFIKFSVKFVTEI